MYEAATFTEETSCHLLPFGYLGHLPLVRTRLFLGQLSPGLTSISKHQKTNLPTHI
jgi:hypothetical protein